jgi:hypothetical protein
MKQIQLTLVRQDSDSTLFTFHDEWTNEVILTKSFELNESLIVDVSDEFNNFKIQTNGTSHDFDFTSSSVE